MWVGALGGWRPVRGRLGNGGTDVDFGMIYWVLGLLMACLLGLGLSACDGGYFGLVGWLVD